MGTGGRSWSHVGHGHRFPTRGLSRRAAPTATTKARPALKLARALSRVAERAISICRGDHALVGGFATFERGERSEGASAESLYIEGDGYEEVPASKWRLATGAELGPSSFFARSFPDGDDPPLRLLSDLVRRVAFDPTRFEVSLD